MSLKTVKANIETSNSLTKFVLHCIPDQDLRLKSYNRGFIDGLELALAYIEVSESGNDFVRPNYLNSKKGDEE